MNNLQLDRVLAYLNEGKVFSPVEMLAESINYEIEDFNSLTESVVLEKIDFSSIKERLAKIWEGFKKFFSNIFEKVKNAITAVKKFLSEKMRSILSKIKKKKEEANNESTSYYNLLEADGDEDYPEVKIYYYETVNKNGKVENKVKVGQLTESKFNRAVSDNKSKLLQNIFTTDAIRGASVDKVEAAYNKFEKYAEEHQVPKIKIISNESPIYYKKSDAEKIAIKMADLLLNHDLPALDKMNEALKFVNEKTYSEGIKITKDISVAKYDNESDKDRISSIYAKYSSRSTSYLSEWFSSVSSFINGVQAAGNYYLALALKCSM